MLALTWHLDLSDLLELVDMKGEDVDEGILSAADAKHECVSSEHSRSRDRGKKKSSLLCVGRSEKIVRTGSRESDVCRARELPLGSFPAILIPLVHTPIPFTSL